MTDKTLLHKAYSNLRYAVSGINDKDDIIATTGGYLIQQAVELTLKYDLEMHAVDYPYTHDIKQLIYLAEDKGVKLIIPEFIRSHADTFTLWESRTRYMPTYSIRNDELLTAYAQALNYTKIIAQIYDKDLYGVISNDPLLVIRDHDIDRD